MRPKALPIRPPPTFSQAAGIPGPGTGGLGATAENASWINTVYTVEAVLVTVILINSASLILWTVPTLERSYSLWFHVVEYCTVAVFLLEYALRFWAAPEANPEGRD